MSDRVDAILFGLFLLAIIVVGGAAVGGAVGFGEMRAPSEYTGYVVDVEEDRGLLFRTTQVHMKTHPRSSAVETFCIVEGEDEKLAQARQALQTQQRVTVDYHRPLFVGVWKCEPGTSIVDGITWSNQSENGGDGQ